MKGFTHFISGIAVASFFPQAVHMASQEQSFILCLGGIFDILPDTLDFKFARFFHVSEFEVRPDPRKLDAFEIASTVAASMEKAKKDGRSTVQLHTMQLGSNLWQSYVLGFDAKTSEVVVDIGPLVDTGQVPYDGTEPKEKASARVKVSCTFFQEFDKKSNIAIMSGPCFEFIKRDEKRVEIVFLPWHRTWSHSATLGIFTAIVVGAATYFVIPDGPHQALYSLHRWMVYPLIIFFGSMVHIVEDSTGFMGNNLFWPFTADRTRGLGFMSAAEAIPNFFFVWTSVICILFNLDRNRWAPEAFPSGIGSYESFFFWLYVLPCAIMLYFFLKGKHEKAAKKAGSGDVESSNDFDSATSEKETDASII